MRLVVGGDQFGDRVRVTGVSEVTHDGIERDHGESTQTAVLSLKPHLSNGRPEGAFVADLDARLLVRIRVHARSGLTELVRLLGVARGT
ncbi:MAG TPA: hypothetical protein VM347_30530 [Nonomuraea sp.]|nr:hypothetical protein [Nonomuraea sp.]